MISKSAIEHHHHSLYMTSSARIKNLYFHCLSNLPFHQTVIDNFTFTREPFNLSLLSTVPNNPFKSMSIAKQRATIQ